MAGSENHVWHLKKFVFGTEEAVVRFDDETGLLHLTQGTNEVTLSLVQMATLMIGLQRDKVLTVTL